MKRLLKFIFVLPTLLFAFTSCEETESTEDMQYANWQARNSSYFTETMNTAKNAIAAAKAQYGNDWEAHCDWRIYCSMYNDATQTGSPTDSIAVFIKERGTGSGCPLYTDTVRVNYIKEVCRQCELNEVITSTHYVGDRKITESKPKWKAVGTHCGRRTFICNALMLGIAPSIVMKWTGHSDYRAMKPYIDIADEAKKNAMNLFDKI